MIGQTSMSNGKWQKKAGIGGTQKQRTEAWRAVMHAGLDGAHKPVLAQGS